MGIVERVRANDLAGADYYAAAEAASQDEIDQVVALLDDADPDVRVAAVTAVPWLPFEPGAEPVAAVLRLTDDPDGRVRDWACFLFVNNWSEVDSPEVREALAARLGDPREDARCQALLGLARRQDPRALPAVREALSRPDDSVWKLELEAAGVLGDPTLHKLVLRHQEGWDDGTPDALAEAVRRLTDPDGPGDDLFAGVAELYRRRSIGEDDGDAIAWWRLMDRMLTLAPRRTSEFLEAADRHLAHDPQARRWLREQSALATMLAAPSEEGDTAPQAASSPEGRS